MVSPLRSSQKRERFVEMMAFGGWRMGEHELPVSLYIPP